MLLFDDRAARRVRATLPGEAGLPIIGNSLEIVRDPDQLTGRLYRQHGPVSWTNILGKTMVLAAGPDALAAIFRDTTQAYENAAWAEFIGPFFPRGLMLLDFDEHRFHRHVMQAAFKRSQLEQYFENMQPSIAAGVELWPTHRPVRLARRLKRLTLDIASNIFMGETLGPESRQISEAFIACVRAGSTIVRYPVPFGRWKQGLGGRALLERMLRTRVAIKRAKPSGDLLSRLCEATDEEGNRFTDDDVINHMVFLMMAAHDTATITLTSVFYQLAKDSKWQTAIREEVSGIRSDSPTLDELAAMSKLDLVVKEAMRILTPVPLLVRRTAKEVDLLGHALPRGTMVGVCVGATHGMAEHWTSPERFDPDRFGEARAEHRRHPFIYSPFGGGAHKCIGLHFGEMEIKSIVHHVLKRYRLRVSSDYVMPVDYTGLPSAADGLPVQLERIT